MDRISPIKRKPRPLGQLLADTAKLPEASGPLGWLKGPHKGSSRQAARAESAFQTKRNRKPAPCLIGERSADLQIFGRFLATVRDDLEAHLRAFLQAGAELAQGDAA